MRVQTLLVLPLVSGVFGSSFDLLQHLGNLSPYFTPPTPHGVNAALPDDATVKQVMLMARHGSRWPLTGELAYIQNLTTKLAGATEYIAKARLPSSMEFLKDGYKTTLGANNLTAIGRRQIFDHGVDFKMKYPQLKATNVLAGNQDRVVESAQWFARGFFGRYWNEKVDLINEDTVTISWITPMDTCPLWQYSYGQKAVDTWGAVYLPPITKRLNKLLPGVNLTIGDTHGALYACAYDHAAYGVSPWCDVFSKDEILDFEYELDLLMDNAFGYNLPGIMGPTLGTLFVNKLIERFTGGTQEMYIEFGHDTTIDMALAALGLAKDKKPLPSSGPVPANRAFRTSYQVPFGAQMVWEKFTCKSSCSGPQIRLPFERRAVPAVDLFQD
ncbi:Phosphoglycerate mutase-like protein [Mycena indigotica]|uniref:Phosphoglycerate mutase-like protein n=1 Tax=Mycena indigotica TaxID=2126181 RepID=A0A8H6T643_9AGAR|nr:Phosphoglycerate mutase-like protein [Mycena indigotica]KAF7312478.1 Phosphoglycerate mutase-like protein [Mycena indigotica]